MSTSTIENIAIGVRPPTPTNRPGRRNKKTLRNMSFELIDLESPAQARAWQASLKEGFTNPHAFDIIMQDINQLDSDFTEELTNYPSLFDYPIPCLAPAARYQEYINSFITLFAQSKFCSGKRGHTEIEVTESLFSHRCPKKKVFCRLAMNPIYIADENPETPDKLVTDTSSIPINQLARICDVAILKFLSTVTDKTDIRSIVWALDYLAEMTKKLELSLRKQSEVGWAGIEFRKRKDTIRRSVINVPQLAVDGRPVVISLGGHPPPPGPASLINPVTGQLTHVQSVPSIAVTMETDQFQVEFTDKSSESDSTSETELAAMGVAKLESFKKEIMKKKGPPTRRQSTVDKPQVAALQQENYVRRNSTGSRPQGVMRAPPTFPKRKTSTTMLVHPTIAEEEDVKVEGEKDLEEDPPVKKDENVPIKEDKEVRKEESVPFSARQSLLETQDSINSSSLDFPRNRSPSPRSTVPSPLLSSVTSLTSPDDHTRSASPMDTSDTESDKSDEPPVRRKTPEPLKLDSASPPPSDTKNLTKSDIETELQTLVTYEGRLSLLAILKAIINLPSSPTLWTEDSWDACHKCFSLIQFCMDFGLDSSNKDAASEKPSRNIRKKFLSKSLIDNESASCTYSRLVLQYAVKALIHCAVCTYAGCSSESCLLGAFSLQRNSRNASQNLNKMTHQLERLYSNSPLQFRAAVIEFSCQATLKQIFHFLHVILQYCPRGSSRDPLDPSSSKRDPLIVLTAAVFRIVVDRMLLLDLNEQTVQHNLVKEMISFTHYATTLFNQEFIRSKGFHNLYQYVQRVALSILLPLPPPQAPPTIVITPTALDDLPEMGTFPRRKDKRKESETATEDLPGGRKRGRTIIGSPTDVSRSPLALKKSPKGQRKRSKQASFNKDPESNAEVPLQKEHPIVTTLKDEWRGLKIGPLHQRIRRLSLLLELSEPGTVPSPSLLSSLFTVGSPGSVVQKALVLVELSLFVRRLNEERCNTWLANQPSLYSWNIFYQLRKWGEAIGEGLRLCIMRESEANKEGGASATNFEIVEESIFPNEQSNPSTDKQYTVVNHSLKMMACIFLSEITKFLREPPQKFLPLETFHAPSSQATPFERKNSSMSNLSMESEVNLLLPTVAITPSDNRGSFRRMSSEYQLRPNLNPEDVPKSLSVEHPVTEGSPMGRKVSIYVRMNSRHGRGQTHPHNIPAVSRKHVPGHNNEAPPDTYRAVHSGSPIKQQNRRMSMSVLLNRQASVDANSAAAMVRNTAPQGANRRMSFAGGNFSKKDSLTRMGNLPGGVGGIQRQNSSSSTSLKATATTQRRRPSVISRVNGLFKGRGRHIAFRRQRNDNRHRPSTTTQTSSAGSSPSVNRKMNRASSQDGGASYAQKIEDLRTNFPWLDIVQHITVSSQKVGQDVKSKRKQSCQSLVAALKHIYSVKFQPPPPPKANEPQNGSQRQWGTLTNKRVSISTIFSDTVKVDGVNSLKPSCSAPPTFEASTTQSMTSSLLQRLSKLDFSGLNLRQLLEYGGVWGTFENDVESHEMSLDQLIEIDSASNLENLMNDYNNERLEYCTMTVSSLFHSPFSLLTYSGPVLSVQNFKDLQSVSWEALLDHDPNCANSAASLFLLSCLKTDKTDMETFIETNVKMSDFNSVKDAVKRFKILWHCRDSVWSKMEDAAPKLFKIDEVNQSKERIGYSLPSQLMGSLSEPLPFPPWDPLSVCPHHFDGNQCTAECYQSTRHAPVEHLSKLSEAVHPHSVRMTNITYLGEENNSTILEVDKEAFEQGIFTVKEHISITLFPNTLLPLINVVIRALCLRPISTEIETSNATAAQIAEYTEEILWQCMLEHPHSLFYPLLNEFNTLYQIVRDKKRLTNLTVEETAEDLLGNILKPFHILLCHYSVLPSETSRYLFNNFIGILMRHTEQPLEVSDAIVHSLLCLLRLVVPSVNDLPMKELKNQLKRASCYTTFLTTARIRGVEKVKVNIPSGIEGGKKTKEFAIDSEDMSFVLLIAKARDIDPSSIEFLSTLHSYYLTDEKTNLPVLSSLIIQDQYSDGSSPSFTLHESNLSNTTGVWSQQMQMLLTHKLCEISRVMFASQMLAKDFENGSHKFTEPNSKFIFEELVQHSSFPRKTLDSVLYEVGPAALQKWQLRVTDSMLRGVWSKFMLTLFSQIKDNGQSDDSIILFLTVLNGSLLLQSEDHIILRNTLAALITAAVKFESVFRTNGYQMVVPSLIQAYALHIRSKMVTDSIKFVWIQFYWQNNNNFLLQAISSIANLFKSDVNSLAASLGLNYSPLKVDDDGLMEEQMLLEKATMSLMSSLNCYEDSHPHDTMDILGACPKEVKDVFSERQWSPCSLDQLLTLCVTVASYNPEVLRGMQILVFIDHLMPLLVKEKDVGLGNFVRSLVKGCEVIKRSQASKGDNLLGRRGTVSNDLEVSEKRNPFLKRIKFRNRSGTSQDLALARERTVSELTPSEQYAKIVDGFRSRRINDVGQDIIHISRDSLLSIVSQFIVHSDTVVAVPTNNRRCPIDVSSLLSVASIVDKVIKSSQKPSSDYLLHSKGLRSALLNMFPQIEWGPDNKNAFIVILDRAVKLFKKIQIDNSTKKIHHGYIWELAEMILESIYMCIQRHPFLIKDNETILNKVKNIIDMCLVVKSTSVTSTRSFIFDVPEASTFTDTVVKLMAETIAISQTSMRRNNGVLLRYFFSGKLHFKDTESSFVWKRLFLPLAINLGLRENLSDISDDDDAMFLTETISHLSEQVHVIIKYRSSQNQLQIKRFFTDLKVILAAFGKKFSLELWVKVAVEIITLATKYDYTVKQRTAFGDDTNEMYIIFCSMFLDFMESFLLTVRAPLYSVIWHAVAVIERQLKSMEPTNPSTRSTWTFCLQKCTRICQFNNVNPVVSSRQELLNNLKTEFLPDSSFSNQDSRGPGGGMQPLLIDPGSNVVKTPHSNSEMSLEEIPTVNKAMPKRRNSKPPSVPMILELKESESPSNDIIREESPSVHKRPTTLTFSNDEKPSKERKKKVVGVRQTSPGAQNSKQPSSDVSPSHKLNTSRNTQEEEEEERGKENGLNEKKLPFNRRRIPRNNYAKMSQQNSEDADESGVDSPRSSFSYSRSPPTKTLSPYRDELTVTAEVYHHSPVSPLTTSFRSPLTISKESNDHQGRRRPLLTRELSIHCDQPDEQTGQPLKERPVEFPMINHVQDASGANGFVDEGRDISRRRFNDALNESLSLLSLPSSNSTERSETLL